MSESELVGVGDRQGDGDSPGSSPGMQGGVFTPGLTTLEEAIAAEEGSGGSGSGGRGRGYAVLACVLAVGAGLLFVMRQAGAGPREAKATETIDYAYAEQQEIEAAERQRAAIEDLSRAGPPAQLPAHEIPRNPFLLAAQAALEDDPVLAAASPEPQESRVVVAAKSLELQAVLDGRVPVARISGQTCRVGDRVGEFFVVSSIEGRSVVLDGQGETFTLTMDAHE